MSRTHKRARARTVHGGRIVLCVCTSYYRVNIYYYYYYCRRKRGKKNAGCARVYVYYTIILYYIEYNYYTRNPRARVREDGIELVVDPGGPPPQRRSAALTGPLTPPPPYVLACGGGVVVVAG